MTATTSGRRQSPWLASCLLASMLLPLTGCGSDSHEKVVDDMSAAMKEMGVVLDGIESVDDAKAAVSDIESLAAKMNAISARANALGDPPADVEKKLQAKAMEMMGPMMATAMKLQALQQDAEIGPVIGDALSKFESAMQKSN